MVRYTKRRPSGYRHVETIIFNLNFAITVLTKYLILLIYQNNNLYFALKLNYKLIIFESTVILLSCFFVTLENSFAIVAN